MASYPITLEMRSKQTQSLKQLQRLIMSPQMQQAIHLLQMPVLELASAIEVEMEQNPLLEYSLANQDSEEHVELEEKEWDENEQSEPSKEQEINFDSNDFEILKKLDEDFRDFYAENSTPALKKNSDEQKKQSYQESLICTEESLFEHLMNQARETFLLPDELKIAEFILGSLDEKGFFTEDLVETALLNDFDQEKISAVLKQIQNFDPFGIAASSLQESFLIQLKCKQREHTLCYLIFENYFDKLLHNQIPLIAKELGCTADEVTAAVSCEITTLDFHPASHYSRQIVQTIVPDVTLKQEGEAWNIIINDDFTPSLKLNTKYLRMLEDHTLPEETKQFLHTKLSSAKWLMKNIFQRNSTLERIVEVLLNKQKLFFSDPLGALIPLTMKAVAEELDLHESTIARAVSNKYIESPRGLLPLRSFFTSALATDEGENVSSTTVRDALLKIIDAEDKHKPLSDLAISKILKDKGVNCARRTVAKYRLAFNIGNAQQRKKFKA